jgi:hypothetical protein
MKTFILAGLFATAFAANSQAATVVLDFAALASGHESGVEGQTFHFGDLAVTLTSSHNAYLDDVSGGKPAGLGVCKVLDKHNQCAPSDDDNLSSGEWLSLAFNKAISVIPGSVFRDDDHNDLSASLKTFLFAGRFPDTTVGSTVDFSFQTFATSNFVPLTQLFFNFDPASGQDFYLGSLAVEYTPSAVPLPAALPMLGFALGGFGLVAARRRRRAA